jgi:hypothetical protein
VAEASSDVQVPLDLTPEDIDRHIAEMPVPGEDLKLDKLLFRQADQRPCQH